MNDTTQELFDTIKLISQNEIRKSKSTTMIVGKIFEYIESSSTYKITYQNIEILATSLGGRYQIGDEVYILLPLGTLEGNKFIVGRTNSRVPTISVKDDRLSDITLDMIQGVIDSMNSMFSDNIITPIEKQNLLIQWQLIQKSNDEVLDLLKDYPEIDSSLLRLTMTELSDIIKPLLVNMDKNSGVNSTQMQEYLGKYLAEESNIRLLIQEALRKELLYKVDITSTNGNSFKNGVINTVLDVIVFQGRKNKTDEIKDEQIVWKKVSSDGTESQSWEKIGRGIKITGDDVSIKQVFLVKIIVEETVVAQDVITIVDLNDIENIVLTLTTTQPKTQVYNPKSKILVPDYKQDKQTIQASVMKGRTEKTLDTRYTWYFNNEAIKSTDSRFTISKNLLQLQTNITTAENPSAKISCIATYYSSEYNMNLEDTQELDFNYITDGSDALIFNFSTPLGTVIKNKDADKLYINSKVYHGDKDVTHNLIAQKWFFNNPDITSDSEYYDKDAGEGWELLTTNNDLEGNVAGYDSDILVVDGDGFLGSITLKSIVYYDTLKATNSITLIDVTDPINVVITGNPILKEGSDTLLTATLFRGDIKIEDVEKYTLEWNLELVKPSLLRRANKIVGWPRYGESIELSWDDLPQNNEVFIICRIYEDE